MQTTPSAGRGTASQACWEGMSNDRSAINSEPGSQDAIGSVHPVSTCCMLGMSSTLRASDFAFKLVPPQLTEKYKVP